ncbi:hypothetical protein N8766_00245 [bacterium]|nr:hypothetical protein [bacterium]
MCTRDEGGPLAAGQRRQAANHRKRLGLRALVVSVTGKGGTRSRQVRNGKTNASESLMTRRKRRDDVKTGRQSLAREEFWSDPHSARAASGDKVA